MTGQLRHWAEAHGYRVAWGPAAIVEDARQDIQRRYRRGDFDDRLYEGELAATVDGASGWKADTVVVVAVPSPAWVVGFDTVGGSLDATLPPTYVRYRATFEDVRQALMTEGLPGARIEHLTAPLKAVAARVRLAEYGRNNLAFVDGLGSYVQLCGYLTDAALPTPEDVPSEPRLMARCDRCSACQRACPTEAIMADRLLLDASRCLTYLNENGGDWPEWVPADAHNSLIGCLHCQQVCPANPPLTVVRGGVDFTREETDALLSAAEGIRDRTENGVRAKLAWLGRDDPEHVLGRNLRTLSAAADPLARRPEPRRRS